MQQHQGGGQFGGANQGNYYIPTPSPYQQQQGTPMSSFVHSPGSSLEQPAAGGVYMHHHPSQQQQGQPQQLYATNVASPAQQSELSRQLGFGSGPASVGSPMAAGGGGGFRSQPPSLQHMLPPTPQPPTPRGGPASVGAIGSVGGGDYNISSYGGPGSANPATPRSAGEQVMSDQHSSGGGKSGATANSSFAASLLDQDSNSQMDSPQQHQQKQYQQPASQEQSTPTARSDLMASLAARSGQEGSSGPSGGSSRGHGSSASASGTAAAAAAQMLQNLDQFGPLSLCSMGKEVTQEIVNRTADMLMMLRTLTDPMQQFPKTATPELAHQLNEKQRRLNDHLRQTASLMRRLFAICTRLEQFSNERLPPDAMERVKELIPVTDNELSENDANIESDKRPSYADDVRLQAEQREEFQLARAEHEKTKMELIKRQEHLKKIMEFLREFCWEISSVLASNASNN